MCLFCGVRLLLVANLFVVLMFIFLSANYFPEADTPAVLLHHPPLNHEPLITKHSATSLRPAPESPRLGRETRQDERLGGDQYQEQLTSTPMEQDAGLTSAVKAAEPELAVEGDQRGTVVRESTELPVDTNGIYEEATTTEQDVRTDDGPKEEDGAEPGEERDPEATEGQKLPSHIAGMLARVKATEEAAKGEQKSSEATLDGELVPRTVDDVDTERGRSFRSRSEEDGQETAQAGN